MNIDETTSAPAGLRNAVSPVEWLTRRGPTPETRPEVVWSSRFRKSTRDYFIFTFCASLYLLPFMRVLLNADEGLLTYGAVRITQGQVFSRDFFEIVGPGTFYWLALFFKVLGVTFFAAHTCLFLTSLATALLIFTLSRRICNQSQTLPSVIIAATSFRVLWPTISHHVDSNCVALLCVYLMIRWIDTRKRPILWAAGMAAGATACFHLPKGLLLLFALLAWMFFQRDRRRMLLRDALDLVSGFGFVVGLVLLYFWSQHAAWDLVNATLLWPSQHYGAVNTLPYAHGMVSEYWDLWAAPAMGLQWTKVLASVLILPLLFIAALPVLLPFLGASDWNGFRRPEISLFWLCGCAIWYSEFHRKDITHLVFGSPVLVILSVYYLQRSRNRVMSVALQALTVTASALAMANLALVGFAHATPTRVGTVSLFRSDAVLAEMQLRIPAGEEVLVYPSNPEYYFLTQTINPIRYGGLMYNYNSQAEFQKAVETLEQHKVRYVVWDTGFMDRNLKAIFPSATPPSTDQLIVEPYLESHYTTVWEEGGVKIMKRKVGYGAAN